MKKSKRPLLILPIGAGLGLIWVIVSGLSPKQGFGADWSGPMPLGEQRGGDPVVLTGDHFPGFLNSPLEELAMYALHAGAWMPIPFQIDEVDWTGTLVISDDGQLDSNDELVFMAVDTGEAASETDWPADPFARLHQRYEIQVADPLSPGLTAWVYLLRSPSLPPSPDSYLSWSPGTQTVAAVSYTLSFAPDQFVGFSDMTINGLGVDILDRQKLRGKFFLVEFTEEDMVGDDPLPVSFAAEGPVRIASGTADARLAIYGARIDLALAVDLTDLPFPPDFIRTSLDLRNPALTGIDTYYDSHTLGGITIDGTHDSVATIPFHEWTQVSGGTAGPGGLVTVWQGVDPGGGSVENFYLDDESANDPGDGHAYGDSGLLINNPGAAIGVQQVIFVLPPGTHQPVGEMYSVRVANPLATQVVEQTFPLAEKVYLPYLSRP